MQAPWHTPALAIALLLLASACAGSDDPDELVGIDVGLYGATSSYDDTGDGAASPIGDVLTVRNDDGVVGTVVSDEDTGFWEMTLDPGTYRVCTSWGTCSDDVFVESSPRRCDFEAGPGGGRWSCRAP